MFPASTPHMRNKQRHKEVPPTPYHLTSQPGGRWWPDSRQVEPGGEGGEGKQGGRGATLGEKASSATTTTTTHLRATRGGNCLIVGLTTCNFHPKNLQQTHNTKKEGSKVR